MHYLLGIVAAIILMSAYEVASISYLSPDSTLKKETGHSVAVGLETLSGGYNSYLRANGAAPAALEDFAPSYTPLPPMPRNITASWRYGTAAGSPYVCLEGSIGEIEWAALAGAVSRIGPRAERGTGTCASFISAAPVSYPSPAAVRMFVGAGGMATGGVP